MTSVGWASVVRAATEVTGWDEETVRACTVAIGDLGEAVSLLLPGDRGEGPSIAEVEAFFRGLAAAKKPAQRRDALAAILRRTSAVEAKYLLKTLSGGLRVGADVTTVEEAIAAAFGADREAVARARRDSGDIGETAAAARAGRLGDIRFRLFHPIGFMLASPIETAEEIEGELARARGRGQVRRHPRPRPQGRRPRGSLLANARRRHAAVSRCRRGARGRAGPLPARRRDRRVGRRAAGRPSSGSSAASGARPRTPRCSPRSRRRSSPTTAWRNRTRLSSRLPGASAAGDSRAWPRRPGCGARRCTPPRPRRSSNPSSPRRGPEATRASC